HGTDVLGLAQYHTLLAFTLFDANSKQNGQVIPELVSLLDIKPTVLAYALSQNATPPLTQGRSLLPYVRGETTLSLPAKHMFLESDYSPAALRTVYPETRKVMLAGIALFQIDP